MSAEKSTIEAELRSMGASHPSLWTALFDVNQAILSSTPLPKMAEWNSVCSTVQDLYHLSLKDPREFAVAQTLTTIMHQHQAKEEILNHVSTMHGGPTRTSEACAPKGSERLTEIQNQLDALSGKLKELDKAVEDLRNAGDTSTRGVPNSSTDPFIIPLGAIDDIQKFLSSFGGYSNEGFDPESFCWTLKLNQDWVSQELKKAKAISELSAPTIFVLYLMLTNGYIFSYMYGETSWIASVTKLVRTAYKDAFSFPRSNVYHEIGRALEASFILRRPS